MITSQRYNPKARNTYKRNYVDNFEFVIPEVYFSKDLSLSGTQLDPINEIINSHITLAKNFSSVIYVSALAGTAFSELSSISGISQFFIKQNNLTEVTPNSFEHDVLLPLNNTFRNYSTSAQFASYLSSNLLSTIVLNRPTAILVDNPAASATHKHLIENLGLLYFLNTSGPAGGYQPSTIFSSLLLEKTFLGEPILTVDGIKGITEYIWRNYSLCATWRSLGLIPSSFVPNEYQAVSSQYTSGTQQLDKLLTMLEVIYSPLYVDSKDFKVRDSFNTYFSATAYQTTRSYAGPFFKLLRAFAFGIVDIDNEVETLNTLYDVEQCPDEYLPLLAELIGWKLFGSDPSRWRLQLTNAVDIYKRTGTKESIKVAVDSLFGQDVFDVTTNIYELWESYIPNLIYYSLATESSIFKDFTTWTRSIANKLGVKTFSSSSMDENLRLATDTILLELVKEFPSQFVIGDKIFPVGSSGFTFNYRNRIFEIPPWEEIPYYAKSSVTEQLILSLIDKLACFGVRKDFALQVGDYIRDNTIRASDDIRVGNSFLMFTSGAQFAPNLDRLVSNLISEREEYATLWNGKSSHYKLILAASSFDFAKDTLEVDSRNAVYESGRIADEFAPAHSIRDTRLFAETSDQHNKYDTDLPILDLNNTNTYVKTVSSVGLTRQEVIGASANTTFSREEANSILDGPIGPYSSTYVVAPRTAFRRRNLKLVLPFDKMYTRTGRNMPTGWQISSTERSYTSSLGFLPLGLIPSAGVYIPIPQYSSIPPIYSICENLSSRNIYSGLTVSNTFPCRGSWPLGRGSQFTQAPFLLSSQEYPGDSDYYPGDAYIDRGQLDPFVAVIHWLKEQEKLKLAEMQVLNSSSLLKDIGWKNVSASIANSSTENFGWFPNSFDEYESISLGSRIQRLYQDYTLYLNRHHTRPDILDIDGPTIFGFAYGSILRNKNFDKLGSLAITYPSYINSSVTNVVTHVNSSGVFSQSPGVASLGTYLAQLPADLIASGYKGTGTKEFRVSSILSGIEFIQTSGSSQKNSFTFFDLDDSFARKDSDDLNYTINNPLIRLKAIDGLPRVKISLKGYGVPQSEGYGINYNLLIPEHEYNFQIKALASNEDGTRLGDSKLGVWIHTPYENGYVWSWEPRAKKWVINHYTDITIEYILNNLTETLSFEDKDRNLDIPGLPKFKCIDSIPTNPLEPNNYALIRSFLNNEFTTFDVKFNTLNQPIEVPEHYYKNYGQVHSTVRDYVFEVFMIPSTRNIDKFILLDNFNLYSETENKRTKYLVSGIDRLSPFGEYCQEFNVPIDKNRLLIILKYFNSLAGVGDEVYSLNSRKIPLIGDPTVLDVGTSGGSRLSYRTHPDFGAGTFSLIYPTLQFYN